MEAYSEALRTPPLGLIAFLGGKPLHGELRALTAELRPPLARCVRTRCKPGLAHGDALPRDALQLLRGGRRCLVLSVPWGPRPGAEGLLRCPPTHAFPPCSAAA